MNLNVTVPAGGEASENADSDNPGQQTPPLEQFLAAGGTDVINRLVIPGEQQVMLKVVVAEVNRAAARSAGLNFNITNNQGITVLSTLPGLSTVTSLSTRNFNTTVEMREGQTLAVAGLIQNNLGTQSARIPLLGDIPYLGRAFDTDNTSSADQELVVLIMPMLVHPIDCKAKSRAAASLIAADKLNIEVERMAILEE